MAVGRTTVAVLGATGSIGTNTLDVLARHPERYRVTALTGHRNVALLAEQCRQWHPDLAVVADDAAARELDAALASAAPQTTVMVGEAGLLSAAASGADVTVAAIVGAAGLRPTLKAVEQGGRILLANKEALVVAGPLVMAAVAASGATLVPVDSEHNAIFQCLPPTYVRGEPAASGVERVVLTASGGPFRGCSAAQLDGVTPEQAVAHPNWSMGRKISVDSATLMNKGLEVIEAAWLFGLPPERLDVVIHPQSLVHSLVAYTDGSTLAQMAQPDMRVPLAHALGWPERLASGVGALDLLSVGHLDFEAPDRMAFPCLDLAFEALGTGGCAGAVLNAANEEAVAAFLNERLAFSGIAPVIRETLERMPADDAEDLDRLLAADHAARRLAGEVIATRLGEMDR